MEKTENHKKILFVLKSLYVFGFGICISICGMFFGYFYIHPLAALPPLGCLLTCIIGFFYVLHKINKKWKKDDV